MSAVWPRLRANMPGLRVRVVRPLMNHDGAVAIGTTGAIVATRSIWNFEVQIDACPHCAIRRRVKYVGRSDVEPVA